MANTYKTRHSVYAAWEYEEEIEKLNQQSAEGWQLIRGGCFHSRFKWNPQVRYRYQMDFQRRVEDMGRYIEIFREQGWEYVNSTFNGWHFFRKLYDPALPEEEYEIFSDRASLQEMRTRWTRVISVLCLFLAVLLVVFGVWCVLEPQLPHFLMEIVLAVELFTLLHGMRRMKDTERCVQRKGFRNRMLLFVLFIVLGGLGASLLIDARPNLSVNMREANFTVPDGGTRDWTEINVRYPDIYTIKAKAELTQPVTLTLLRDGQAVYTVQLTPDAQNTAKSKKHIYLQRGSYRLALSDCQDAELDLDLEVI